MSLSESQNYRYQVATYDGILRMMVPSRQPKTPPYLVELNAYECNGMCVCKHFVTRLEPLLKRAVTPQAAVDQGLVKVPPWGTVEDALRCFHIHVARLKFADDVLHAIVAEEKKKYAQAKNTPQARRVH